MSILRSEIRGRVLVLTLDGPESRNALGAEVYAAGLAALSEAPARAGAVVLTGAGGTFCSGGDLNGIVARRAAGEEAARAEIDRLNGLIRALRDSPLPVIGAVEGWAAGAGFSLALGCDMLVASRAARFVMAYVKVGLSPDGGGSAALGRMVPRQIAAELLMEGTPIGAERLHALGLVNELTEPGAALDAALSRAERLARGPRAALTAIKRLIASAPVTDLDAQLEAERDAFARNLTSSDAGEGIAAFFEKRPPVFGTGN